MRIFFIRGSQLSIILLTLLSLTAYFGGSFRYFELTSHFRVQYLVLSLLLVPVFFTFRLDRWIVLGLLAAVINAYEVVPIYLSRNDLQIVPPGRAVTLLLANVQRSNTEYSKLIKIVDEYRPDFLAVVEPDTAWVQALDTLTSLYPNQKIVARDDNFGIALYSRIPFDGIDVVELGDIGVPSIAAKLLLGKKEVTILATHPLPPLAKQNYDRRNSQLSAISTYIRALSGSKIIIGDLNVTLWSVYFTRLLQESELVNTRQGHGILPTWPTYLPFMMIPLDHCLVSPDIMIKNITTLSNIGSDHLPLLLKLEI